MNNEPTDSLSNTIYARVTDSLRSAIIGGEFKPGQKLKMSSLTERFGTSQMPIREALQQLQGEGLVTIAPHRGACVKKLDPDFVINICDLRMAIESLMVQKACEQKDKGWIKELKEAQDIFDSLIEEEDLASLIKANRDFHKIHNRIAKNEEAMDMLERTHTLLTYIRATYGYPKERIIQMSKEHHKMIGCFEKQDVNGVLKIHEEHCENAKSTFLKGKPE